MGSRSKRTLRCASCRMHRDDCLCALVPRLDLKTRVVVIMHCREWKRPTASAPLFILAAPNSEIRLRGRKDMPFDDKGIVVPDRRTWLLYPGGNATVLSPDLVQEDPRPVTLVVPDGSWRQASKVGQREPALAGVSQIVLPDMGPSSYRLRNEPKEGGLSTFEAISRALRILEGEAVYAVLEDLFQTMVERTLATRRCVVSD
jgi:DTW domain-containing protein YfiP